MQAFLESVSIYALKHYRNITGELCMVTPNRRSILFLRKHFSRHAKEVMWAPDMLSMEDFVNRLSGLRVVDSLGLLLRFFETYRELHPEAETSVDHFLQWAPVALNDFEETDAHVGRPAALFMALADARRIEMWNPDGAPPTAFQADYLAFCNRLGLYQQGFEKKLLRKKEAYQGLSSRVLAGRLEEIIRSGSLPWKKVIFAGFNALNQAEESIIEQLLQAGLADYLLDSDPYYTDNAHHEAGNFLRKYIRKWKLQPPHPALSGLRGSPIRVRVMGIGGHVSQARLAGKLLEENREPNERTAIVLADESLLIPVLNALPGQVSQMNVTMGYPLDHTRMYGFFESLFLLLRRPGHAAADHVLPGKFYRKDLDRLFNHPAAALLMHADGGQAGTEQLLSNMGQSGKSHFDFQELMSLAPDPQAFSRQWSFLNGVPAGEGLEELLSALIRLSSRLDQLLREKAAKQGADIIHSPYFVDFESLYYFASAFRKLQSFASLLKGENAPELAFRLFRQMAASTRLSFQGEPLEGLQIMGMLETRNLDFDHLILLSANEHVLPRPKGRPSFIPYDLRKEFGIPLHHDRDATYAYHFYRLLQRAKQVDLIYNTQTQDLGSNEKSRFITQLMYELKSANPRAEITESLITLPPHHEASAPAPTIPKSREVMQLLLQTAARGFSPSALTIYLSCPLRFYFERLARISELQAVEETVEASTLGIAVHEALQKLYKPYLGECLEAGHLGIMQKQLPALLRQAFREHLPGADMKRGKNLLLSRLYQHYIRVLLKRERDELDGLQQHDKRRLLALEKPMKTSIPVRVMGKTREVYIKGLADRIDQQGKLVRVIDYKTGKVDGGLLRLREWVDLIQSGNKHRMVFQLLAYAWMYGKIQPGTEQVLAGILSLRSPNKGLLHLQLPGDTPLLGSEQAVAFESCLTSLLEEIMDDSTSFNQTEDVNQCTHCSFRILCRRF